MPNDVIKESMKYSYMKGLLERSQNAIMEEAGFPHIQEMKPVDQEGHIKVCSLCGLVTNSPYA